MNPDGWPHAAGEASASSPSGHRGLLIAVEGGDGAGKSTQIARLTRWLDARGRSYVVTREPGGTPLGRAVRDLLLHGGAVSARAETLLFAADRAHHVETVIRPALDAGQDVITDRFMESSSAYQGAGRDLSAAEVREVSLWATGGLVPDLTILLDVPVEVGAARRGVRGRSDRMEAEDADFHDRVRAGFLDLARAAPERYVVVNGALSADAIGQIVAARLEATGWFGDAQ